MPRIPWIVLVAVCLLSATFAQSATLDPLLRSLVETPSEKAVARSFLPRVIALDTERERVGVILHLDGGLPDLGAVPGLVVGSVCGEIATARVPTSSLAVLVAVDGIRHVSAARLMQPHLDVAVPLARVDEVWNGAPALTGNDVLVGVIDTGIDTDHPDFRTEGNQPRVEAVWDMFGNGTPPDGFSTGVELTLAEIYIGSKPPPDTIGHGTHVTGIAAGNGNASYEGQYSGVAPEAGILFVDAYDESSPGFAEDAVIDAMNYLVSKAQSLGKPIAINMSFGGHADAHDGTSPREIVLEDLSREGTVFCVSAGNEGEALIHDSGPAASTQLVLNIPAYTATDGSENDYVFVIIWVDGDSSPTVRVGNGNVSLGPVSSGNWTYDSTDDGTIWIDNASDGVDPANGDKAIYVQFDDYAGTAPVAGDWTIRIEGGTGTAHAWKGGSTMTAYFPDSDQAYSVAVPACAEVAVAVGAFKSRNSWPGSDGTYIYSPGTTWGDTDEGDRAPFSSIGPARTGGEKPDVVAPGMAIVSCLSSDASAPPELVPPGGRYVAMQGTSMSSPLVCGVAALMFQKNPFLTAAEVRQILRTTASTDGYTGTTWNAHFGAGKVDAQAALAAVPPVGEYPDGDLDDDGVVTVLDVVLTAMFILDPSGHPLTLDQRAAANVYPPPAGDGTVNVSDLALLVAFVLGTETPATKSTTPACDPVVATIGEARREADGWFIPLTLRGDGMAAGQFALSLPKEGWRDAPVRVDAAGEVCFASRIVGSQLRALFYDVDNELPSEITVRLPCFGPDAPGVAGLLVVDATGAAREIDLQSSPLPRVGYLTVAPNPAPGSTSIHFGLARAGEASVSVYDLSGRLVRRLRANDTSQTEGVLAWHGDDDHGRALPAGVYLVQLRGGGEVVSKKVVLQR